MTKRAAFVSTVSRLMDEDDKLVLCLGDISIHAFRDVFIKHPRRCYNLGCTEFASIGVCAGLAMSGLYPIFHTISPFIVRRAFESLHIGFGLQRLFGLFVGVGGASDYAKLGPTHCCPEELELARLAKIPAIQPWSALTVTTIIEQCVRERLLQYLSIEEGA